MSKRVMSDLLSIAEGDKAELAAMLVIAEEEKADRANELIIAAGEKAELVAELVIANAEKAKRAALLIIANHEKEKRADELIIAGKELVYQNEEKAKRAAELVIADVIRKKSEAELITLNKELIHQIEKCIEADHALKESNEKYSEAFKSAPYSITITGTGDKKLFEVNDAFTTIFGFTREEAISKTLTGLRIWVNAEDQKWVFTTLLDGRIVSGKEFFFRKKNGEIIIGLFSSRIVNINKEPFIISNIDDITLRKQVEHSLKESEQKSRSIMENSADAIFLTNQQGKYLYTNKAVTDMLGYSSEEMLNKTIVDISPPDKIEEYLRILKQILSGGKNFAEIELVKKDGGLISTDLNAVLLPDGMIYASCRDITQRKLAESELIKAKEKAEENDRLKSAFLSNMSHEIRTPLNGILGFTELLREPNLTIDEQLDFIETIQISGTRLLNTINNIVDISKIESGLMNLDIKETNINDKMEFTYKFFKQEVESKGLQLLFKNGLPSSESIIYTDNEKVYSVLTNLVKNAIKFTSNGSIEFGYKKKGNYLEFFVNDTGTGIKKSQEEIVFERFRQGSESLDRIYEGSGLGLAICKSYVEMLDGKIWLVSEEGKGSVFYFTIPYNPVLSGYINNENVISEIAKNTELKRLKILVVEDDEISYSLLRRILNNIGNEVLHALTGFEAIEICRNNPDLDLVLMDIRMPGMNGIDATRLIRQFNKEIIIIAQTAYAFAGDSEMAIQAGCNDYISKPINSVLLNDLIKKHVNKSVENAADLD